MTLTDLRAFLASYRGGVSPEEGEALSHCAEQCVNGVIVEIGSFRGKSAVALAAGQARGRFSNGGLVHSVDPHLPFKGFNSGVSGPQDRRDFYKIMLETGFYQRVCLINVPSAIAAKGWQESIGLLFMDDDHTLAEVRSDVSAWERHLQTGGIVVFGNAFDPAAGPYHVINDLMKSGRFERHASFGKMIALRKVASEPHGLHQLPQRILVACHNLAIAGGLYRFERVGRRIKAFGHSLAYVALGDAEQKLWSSDFPVLRLEEALRTTWDVTIVPGAGFPKNTIDRFSELQSGCFGLRVQHVLTDQIRRSAFLHVNSRFKPDVVIFNNRHWKPGDFTEFQAKAFHFLEGGVDLEALAPDPRRTRPSPSGPFVVGGLANKNAQSIVDAVRMCDENVRIALFGSAGELAERERSLVESGRLRLLGILRDEELPDFFASVDCVAHTETSAGWANIAAEGMASGLPVICTPHGTAAFAEHETTALVVPTPSPAAIAAAIQRLRDDPELARRLASNARQAMRRFSWNAYAPELLRLMTPPVADYYTWSPDLGLFGKWPEPARMMGLDPVLSACAGKTILDLGAAEGVIARRFLERGALLVDGFEREPSRVRIAAGVCGGLSGASFWEADLSDWTSFEARERGRLRASYDIVLYLGLHHHLPASSRMSTLAGAARKSSEFLVIRTPPALFSADSVESFLSDIGFVLTDSKRPEDEMGLGDNYIFRRGTR